MLETASFLPQLLRSVWPIAGHHADQGLVDVGVYQEMGSRLELVHPEQRPHAKPGLAIHPGISSPPAAGMPAGHTPGLANNGSASAQMSSIIAQAKALQPGHGNQGAAEDRLHEPGQRRSSLRLPDTEHPISKRDSSSPNMKQEEGNSSSALESSKSSVRPQLTSEEDGTREPQLTSKADTQPQLAAEEAQAEEAWRERQGERERQRKVRTIARLKANLPSEELFILYEMMVTVDKENVDDALLQHIALAIKVSLTCIQQG